MTNATSSPPTHSGWLLVCQQQSVVSLYETGIFGKRISCITAHTMVRQLVSVVKASIGSVRCRTLLKKLGVRIGTAYVAMHDRRESIKRQKMKRIFTKNA